MAIRGFNPSLKYIDFHHQIISLIQFWLKIKFIVCKYVATHGHVCKYIYRDRATKKHVHPTLQRNRILDKYDNNNNNNLDTDR